MDSESNIEADKQDDCQQSKAMSILMGETRSTLNSITGRTLDEKVRHMIYVLNKNASSTNQVEMVLNVMIDVGVDQWTFAPQYAQLIARLCDVDDWRWTSQPNIVRGAALRLCKEKHLLYWFHAIPLQGECSVLLQVCDDFDVHLPREIGMIICQYSVQPPGQFEQFDKKDKFVGIQTMIGQLFNFNVVSCSALYENYLRPLFGLDESVAWRRGRVESVEIEAICKMLDVCGKTWETSGDCAKLDECFGMLKELTSRQNPRLKFMVRDLCDLRQSGWIRRDQDDDLPNQRKKSAKLPSLSERSRWGSRNRKWRRGVSHRL